MIVRELLTKWGITVEDGDLTKLDKKIKKTGESLKKMGQRVNKFGKALSLRVTLPVLGLGAAFVNAASNAVETESAFNAVFKTIQGDAAKTAKALARGFGLSELTARELLLATGDVVKGFGLTEEEALDLSRRVQELSVDLASFKNVQGGAARASEAITKALLGEREMLKTTLRTAILETEVMERAKVLRRENTTLSERQAKIFATLAILQERNADAVGDFARTSHFFAGQLRFVQQRAKDVAVMFGKILLPTALKLIKALKSGLEFLQDLQPETRRFIVIAALVAAALGPVLMLFGQLSVMLGVLTIAFGGMGTAALLAQAKLLLIPLAILAIAAAIFLIAEDIIAFFRGNKSVTAVLVEKFTSALDFINKKWMEMPLVVKAAVALMTFPIRSAILLLRTFAGVIKAVIAGDFKEALAVAARAAKQLVLPNLEGVGGALGFGRLKRPTPFGPAEAAGPPAPATAAAAGARTSNVNVTMNAPINVPPGTPPELVGTAVREGVAESLSSVLRDTQRAVQPQGAF